MIWCCVVCFGFGVLCCVLCVLRFVVCDLCLLWCVLCVLRIMSCNVVCCAVWYDVGWSALCLV